MCCTRLAGNAGPKKSPKIHHLGTIAQLCRAISSQLRHVSKIEKKLVKQHYLFHMSPQYGKKKFFVNFSPLTTEICWLVWGTPGNFHRFRVLASLLHRRSTKLCRMFGRLLGWYTMPGAKFTLRSSVSFSYIGSVTAQHSNNSRQPNFVAWYTQWNYGTFAEGATYIRLGDHHVGHWPTC